jgi:hypothetical protein
MQLFRWAVAACVLGLANAGCGWDSRVATGAEGGAVGASAGAAGANAGGAGAGAEPDAVAAGGAGAGAAAAGAGAAGSNVGPPEPATGNSACVISADCPDGQHCDLGECIQSCSTEQPCSGELVCSARGRCLQAEAPDADPAPSPEQLGSVTVQPSSVVLTDQDESLFLTLSSTSPEPVRYRVQVDAPHLRIDQPRGDFTEQTSIQLAVDTASLTGRDVVGTVRIFTTLGDLSVSAPMHVGVTGTYHGALRYDGGMVSLGETRVALDIIENNGDVSVRVDPDSSLLFPRSDAGDATGRGSYSRGQGLRFVISQRFEAEFGGERNHFQRPIGRRLSLALSRGAQGRFEGTFDETVYGLFTSPVRLTGSVALERRPTDQEPVFTVAEDPQMPDAPSAAASLLPTDVFGWSSSCVQTLAASDSSVPSEARNACAGWRNSTAQYLSCVSALETVYYEPLPRTLDLQPSAGAQPLAEPMLACQAALAADSYGGYHADSDAAKCALPPVLACALSGLLEHPSGDLEVGQAFSRLVARMAAPALLVAQEHVVQGLYESFSLGRSAARQRYDLATQTLGPVVRWLLQSGILEFARQISAQAARADTDDPSSSLDYDPTRNDFPAGRALARLSYLLSHIDGERGRIDGAGAGDLQLAAAQAQQRAVLTFLEAATVNEIISSWGSAPASLAASFAGVLTPIDRGFAALRQGATAFGVPESFVPFVYRGDPGAADTNFEQMMALASAAVAAESSSESAFTSDLRAYERNKQELQAELASVRDSYDRRLASICGSAFDPESITFDEDWERCGPDGSGEVGELRLELDEAKLRMQASFTRLQNMRAQIEVDRQRLADTQGVHADNLVFMRKTGDQLENLIWEEGIINAAQTALSTAASSNALNFGAPLGMAALGAILEGKRTTINVARNNVETAQQLRLEQSQMQIELINGMADIQRQMIDLAQLGVEIELDGLLVAQAELRAKNAVQEARQLLEERARGLHLVDQSPAHDPTYRLLRDQLALNLIRERSNAQSMLYLAGRALEYELNTSLDALSGAVLAATNSQKLQDLEECLRDDIFAQFLTTYGTPQQYTKPVSVRELLGIRGERVDPVTGELLSEGEQFRRLLLQNENLDAEGGVGVTLSTNLQPGNGLWSADVCADKIASIEAQVVGDFLGDNEVQVNVALEGASFLRTCDTDQLTVWSLDVDGVPSSPSLAVVQGGVNTFGETQPNTTLFGRSVAYATWEVIIPGPANAPANADLDLTRIEDIVLKVTHRALPRNLGAREINSECLAGIAAE